MIENIYFETTNTVFTRAQALVWVANGLSMLDLFEKSTGILLSEIIDKCPVQKSLLVNFNGIFRLDDHCLDEVYDSLVGNQKQLIILNGSRLFDELNKLKKDKEININFVAESNIIILGNQRQIKIESLLKEKQDLVTTYLSTKLKATYTKFDQFKRLCSTPFLANGEFDSKKIIESPMDFMWFSFHLSDKLKDIIETEKLHDVVLVSASLRGAVFTSILGIINDIEYINIDHVGPIHRVYNYNPLDSKHQNRNYLYIGDFVFGGTEIKLTKVYASFGGAKLDHALVLGSLFPSEVFTDFKLYELNTLSKISEEADYKLFDEK
jgi:hypothetical protein